MREFTKLKIFKSIYDDECRFYLKEVAIAKRGSYLGDLFLNKQLYTYGYYLETSDAIYRIIHGPMHLIYWYNGNNLLPHSLMMSEII